MSLSLKDLCRNIGLPKEVIQTVSSLEGSIALEQLEELDLLFDSGKWDEGLQRLRTRLGEDKHGFKILTVVLYAALRTKKNYEVMGIEDAVFWDTMKCITRFVNEYRESFGVYGFDRAFWVPRQLSGMLFRLGSLEFEMLGSAGVNMPLYSRESMVPDEIEILDIHIPSDADISREKCEESYIMAKQFFFRYFPEFRYKNICCRSWLLAPGLKDVLPENSRIIQFQNQFQITKVHPENQEFLIWIYKRKDIPYENLPENTTLQKNVKRYLLEGKYIGSADGNL